jgi:hypothetical protein
MVAFANDAGALHDVKDFERRCGRHGRAHPTIQTSIPTRHITLHGAACTVAVAAVSALPYVRPSCEARAPRSEPLFAAEQSARESFVRLRA